MNIAANDESEFFNADIISQRSSDFLQDEEETLTNETILVYMQELLDQDRKKADEMADRFARYFSKKPYEFDLQPIEFLNSFFDPTSAYGLSGIKNAIWILGSIMSYYSRERSKRKRSQNSLCNEILLSPTFLEPIYPHMFESGEVMEYFICALDYQVGLETPTVFAFLMEKNFLASISEHVVDDYPELSRMLRHLLVLVFKHYTRYLTDTSAIDSIVYKAIDLFYSKPSHDSLDQLSRSIGDFAYKEILYAKYFIHHQSFTTFCEGEEDQETILIFLETLIDVLSNPSTQSSDEQRDDESGCVINIFAPSGADIRSEIKPLQDSLLILLNNLIQKQEIPYFSPCLKIISLLTLTPEFIQHSIDSGFIQFIFEILGSDIPFKIRADCFAAICQFVQFSNPEHLAYIFELGFFNILENWIDAFINEIPHQILDALENVCFISETNEQCAEWSELIFDNEEILECLEKAENQTFNIRHDPDIPVDLHAGSLLARRFNILQ